MGRHLSKWVVLTALAACIACDDDADGLGESECELALTLSGAIQWSTPSAPACGIPVSGGIGISMGYIFIEGEVQHVDIDVLEIQEGETGTFAARVAIMTTDGRRWATSECSVEIDEHVADPSTDDDFSRGFIVHATGACTETAMAIDGTGDPIEVMPFELRFPPRWR